MKAISSFSRRGSRAVAAALGFAWVLLPTIGLADGTEILGPPGIEVAAGSGIVAAGASGRDNLKGLSRSRCSAPG